MPNKRVDLTVHITHINICHFEQVSHQRGAIHSCRTDRVEHKYTDSDTDNKYPLIDSYKYSNEYSIEHSNKYAC